MTGLAYKLTNELIEKRSNGNASIKATTKTKLLLQGVDVEKLSPTTTDSKEIIQKIRDIARNMNISLSN